MSLTASEAAALLAARASAVIPGGVNSGQRRVPGLEQLIITATSGSTFTDGDGRTYTDYHAAFGPPLLGHNDPDVDAAAAAAGRSVGLMGVGVTQVEIELAERLVAAVPSLEKVLLTCTGSEATFHALRLARTATGRRHVIKFQGCYHGWHDSVAMNVISPAERVGTKDPLSGGMLPEVVEATIVCPFNDADAVERALDGHDGDVAAIIIEPIPHNLGAVLPQPGFLDRLRELATKHGTVLVFDEVITGFRHGLGGYQSIAGVTPDLTTLGKAMANGWPVSALGGTAELMLASQLRGLLPHGRLLAAVGLLSVLAAVLLLLAPRWAAAPEARVIGLYALLSGLFLSGLAVRLRREQHALDARLG
jgi:glutamate-1-semialdehyde 2,1-aminomutase